MSRSKEASADDVLAPWQAIVPGTSQKVTIGGTSAASSALGAGTTIVRVFSDTDCHLAFGAAPTAVATGTNLFLPAGIAEYFGVTPGSKIAVIQDLGAGTLRITEGA